MKSAKKLARWSYRCCPREGKCSLNGEPMYAHVTLESAGPTDEVPDVCEVEAWLKAFLKGTPTTAEELAFAAAERWQMTAHVSASASGHGPIEATAEWRAE